MQTPNKLMQELLKEKLASQVTLHFGFDPFYHNFIELSPMFLFFGSDHQVKFVYTNHDGRNLVAQMGLNVVPNALDC